MKLTGVVIYCDDVDVAKGRYQKLLGKEPVREQHGEGPIHWAFTLDDGIVIELYPQADRHMQVPGVALLSFEDDPGRMPFMFRVLLTNRKP